MLVKIRKKAKTKNADNLSNYLIQDIVRNIKRMNYHFVSIIIQSMK